MLLQLLCLHLGFLLGPRGEQAALNADHFGGLAFVTREHPCLNTGALEVDEAATNVVLKQIFYASGTLQTQAAFNVLLRIHPVNVGRLELLERERQCAVALRGELFDPLHDGPLLIVKLLDRALVLEPPHPVILHQCQPRDAPAQNGGVGAFREDEDLARLHALHDPRHHLPRRCEVVELERAVFLDVAKDSNRENGRVPVDKLAQARFGRHFNEAELVLARPREERLALRVGHFRHIVAQADHSEEVKQCRIRRVLLLRQVVVTLFGQVVRREERAGPLPLAFLAVSDVCLAVELRL